MRKTVRLLIIILLIFVILLNVNFSALNPQIKELFQSRMQTVGALDACNSHYYKNILTDPKEIELYEEIESAVFYRVENYTVNFTDKDSVDKISLFVCLDNPFFTITNSFYSNGITNHSFLERLRSGKLPFVFDDENYYDKMTAAYQKAKEIMSEMPDYTGEYDKIKYLHDYIVTHVRYTDDAADSDADTAYGALINGKARCEGYTNAFSILLNLAGIENAKIFYFGENDAPGHIWNLVKINGSYYHVDTTNDSFNASQDVPANYISYAYFLISTADIKKTSQINETLDGLIPACDDPKDNFFIRNQLYFDAYDRLKIGKAAGAFLSQQSKENKAGVSIKFKNADDYNKALSSSEIRYLLSVIADYDDLNATYFTYYMNDKQQVITFFPQ